MSLSVPPPPIIPFLTRENAVTPRLSTAAQDASPWCCGGTSVRATPRRLASATTPTIPALATRALDHLRPRLSFDPSPRGGCRSSHQSNTSRTSTSTTSVHHLRFQGDEALYKKEEETAEQVGTSITPTERADWPRLGRRDGGCEGAVATGLAPPSRGSRQPQEEVLTMLMSCLRQLLSTQREASAPLPPGVMQVAPTEEAMVLLPPGDGGRGARQRARDLR